MQSSDDRFGYVATFVNLHGRSPPSSNILFGANITLIQDRRTVFQDDMQYWSFRATDAAQKQFRSGKTLMRHLGPIIDVTEEMWALSGTDK
jgi:hypothetical protein